MARSRERDLTVAQHEAAHVVVGVALGLRLREAVVGNARVRGVRGAVGGYAYFAVPRVRNTAWALTLAAGVAWDRAVGDDPSPGDLKILRSLGYTAPHADALAFAAGAILETRGAAHARVTRALLERDLRGADIAAIARGERIDDD